MMLIADLLNVFLPGALMGLVGGFVRLVTHPLPRVEEETFRGRLWRVFRRVIPAMFFGSMVYALIIDRTDMNRFEKDALTAMVGWTGCWSLKVVMSVLGMKYPALFQEDADLGKKQK